VTTSLEGG